MERCKSQHNTEVVHWVPRGEHIMLDYDKIKTQLEENFQVQKADGIDIDININVISETNGKFSVSIHDKECSIAHKQLDKSDITVGFVNEDTLLEMFLAGGNPISLVMGGKMTFNGDMAKGKELKGLFVE
jgi:putative sterol carrier protein